MAEETAGRATVDLYRLPSAAAGWRAFTVLVDGRPVERIWEGERLALSLPSGRHRLALADGRSGSGQDELDLAPGEVQRRFCIADPAAVDLVARRRPLHLAPRREELPTGVGVGGVLLAWSVPLSGAATAVLVAMAAGAGPLAATVTGWVVAAAGLLAPVPWGRLHSRRTLSRPGSGPVLPRVSTGLLIGALWFVWVGVGTLTSWHRLVAAGDGWGAAFAAGVVVPGWFVAGLVVPAAWWRQRRRRRPLLAGPAPGQAVVASPDS